MLTSLVGSYCFFSKHSIFLDMLDLQMRGVGMDGTLLARYFVVIRGERKLSV